MRAHVPSYVAVLPVDAPFVCVVRSVCPSVHVCSNMKTLPGGLCKLLPAPLLTLY